jgi:hypothetical protein
MPGLAVRTLADVRQPPKAPLARTMRVAEASRVPTRGQRREGVSAPSSSSRGAVDAGSTAWKAWLSVSRVYGDWLRGSFGDLGLPREVYRWA